MERARIVVDADPREDAKLRAAAAHLALDLNLPLAEIAGVQDAAMLLVVTDRRIELRAIKHEEKPAKKGKSAASSTRGGSAGRVASPLRFDGNPVFADLTAIDTTSPAGRSLKQPILKAMGVKKRADLSLTVVDATAGWGEDAWLLAAMGCRVLAVERSAVMATLLRDGWIRAFGESPHEAGRLTIIRSDARHLLRRIGQGRVMDEQVPAELADFLHPDVVYLDPMYPDHADRKTAERKPLRLLRSIVGDDGDADELLPMAMRAAKKRVVVKRPARATPLGGVAPTTTVEGKGFRFDVYVASDRVRQDASV